MAIWCSEALNRVSSQSEVCIYLWREELEKLEEQEEQELVLYTQSPMAGI